MSMTHRISLFKRAKNTASDGSLHSRLKQLVLESDEIRLTFFLLCPICLRLHPLSRKRRPTMVSLMRIVLFVPPRL